MRFDLELISDDEFEATDHDHRWRLKNCFQSPTEGPGCRDAIDPTRDAHSLR